MVSEMDTGRAARRRRPWGVWEMLRSTPVLGRGLDAAGLLGAACRRQRRRGMLGSGQGPAVEHLERVLV